MRRLVLSAFILALAACAKNPSSTPDAGLPAFDAGSSEQDAGPAVADAGQPPADAGSVEADAGPTESDGGSDSDAGISDAGAADAGASDPCLTDHGGCDANATCLAGPAGTQCTCNPGYSGDGHTCQALPKASAWAESLSGAQLTSIAVDASGNVYAGGVLNSATTIGNTTLTPRGMRDALVVKFDSAGNYLWAQQFQGPLAPTVAALTVTTDGGVIAAGYYSQDIEIDSSSFLAGGSWSTFVAWLDSSGHVTWAQSYGSSTDNSAVIQASSVAADGTGNVLVGVTNPGELTGVGAGVSGSVGVMKVDSSGGLQWAFGFGVDPQDDELVGVAADSQNNVVVAAKVYGLTKVCGQTWSPSGIAQELVVKLSPDGQCLWSQLFNGEYLDPSGVGITPGDGVAVAGLFNRGMVSAGSSSGTCDKDGFYAAALDSQGHPLWLTTDCSPDGNNDRVSAFAVDHTGGVVMGGFFTESKIPFADTASPYMMYAASGFVSRFDAGGHFLSTVTFGDPMSYAGGSVTSLATDAAGNLYLAGEATGTVKFSSGVAAGVASGAVVAKLAR